MSSIYITQDFGASDFPDVNGKFAILEYAGPLDEFKVEGENSVATTSSQSQPGIPTSSGR